MRRIVLAALCTLALTGCANLRSPKFVDVPGPTVVTECPPQADSYCLLTNLSEEYRQYYDGAQDARVISDVTALSATGGAVIGAATNAHSDLYKATAGIALTAMGFSRYANFKTQALVSRATASKLTCAATPLASMLGLQMPDKAAVAAGTPIKAMVVVNPLSSITAQDAAISTSSGGKSLLIQNIDIGNAVALNDYMTITSLAETLNNAAANIEKSQRILREINAEATSNLVGLQLSAINQIETDSFKLEEAINLIKQVDPKDVKPTPKAQSVIKSSLSSTVLEDNQKAVAVIENYNRYIRCMSGDFAPTTF
ncbi:hypothetical protein HV782_012225 [Pseudomonas monsensis]|uniref:hypothetical protein n=1 Tax=Pseudomonas monsensis TaxID=2745509 RepID=UPI001648B209|nr:hypothetical protein [Pseudomonas monsensis]QXI02710.1 hypothetical protein HV782_012225 [Pseudomonas monsensis]